jgi:hypothetical protein
MWILLTDFRRKDENFVFSTYGIPVPEFRGILGNSTEVISLPYKFLYSA